MRRTHATLFAAALLAGTSTVTAATRNGDPDPHFGTAGLALVDVGDGSSTWVAMDRLPDGKLLLGGSYDAGLPTGVDFVIARLNADGSLDTNFSFDGKVEIPVGPADSEDQLFDLLVQPNGKIVLLGTAQSANSSHGIDMALVRLNPDGALDNTFGVGGKVFVDFGLGGTDNSESARAMALFSDGKLIVAGSTPVTGEGVNMALVKLNPDGSRDTFFGTGGRVTVDFGLSATFQGDHASSVAIDSQGRIVVAGSAAKSSINDIDFAVARLLGNGQLDSSFSGDGRHTIAFDIAGTLADQAFGLIVDSDDAITLIGVATDNDYDMAVVRLLPDGSPTPGFGNAGRITIPFDLAGPGNNNMDAALGGLQHRDKLLLVGTGMANLDGVSPEQVTMIAQVLPDGQLDPDFGRFGKAVIANSIGGTAMGSPSALQDEGRALLGTVMDTPGNQIRLAAQAILLDVLFADGHELD